MLSICRVQLFFCKDTTFPRNFQGFREKILEKEEEKEKNRRLPELKCFYIDIFATKNLEQMVQLMASEIIGKLVTVSQSALRKVQEQAMAYQNYCAWLTENQQMLLLAIASERLVSSPLSQLFISTHHLPATSSVKTALKALVDKQLVSKTPKGYLVSDRFFAKGLVRVGM